MNKNLKKIGILLLVVLLAVAAVFGLEKISEKIHLKNIKDYDWLLKNVTLLNSSMGKNIYTVSKSEDIDIYNENYRKVVDKKYENIDKKDYTFEKPLVIHNLYGTNALSLNIFFNSEEETYLKYYVSVDDKKVNDFSRVLKNDGKNNLTKTHEYQIIGLVPGYKNTITLKLKDKTSKTLKEKQIVIDLTELKTNSQTFAKVTEGTSKSELEDGLFAILGNDSDIQDYLALYDNDGVLRTEIPIIGYRAHKILFKDNYMYFSISQTKIVKMSNTGRIEDIYRTGKYQLHHDYTFTDDGNIIVLANNTEKDTEEDCIIKIDLETKEVKELVDFEPMFQSYVDTCTLDTTGQRDEGEDGLDWLHLNSIEYVNGDVFLSSRETSSILKVKNIETKPELKYILSAEEIWEDTDFEDYVYDQKGDFKIHAGQHSVRYTPTSDSKVYYLTFFDNNYGKANSQPKFDYSKIGIKNNNPFQGDHSYYYTYKVDERKERFELVDSIELVYSGIVSSIQDLDNGNVLTDSGTAGVFTEYDKKHNLIRSYELKMNKYMVYRVYKYDFNNFWFED